MPITEQDREKWARAVDAGKTQVWEKLQAFVEASKDLKEAINNPDFLGDAPTAISGAIKLSMDFENIFNAHVNAGNLRPFFEPVNNMPSFNAMMPPSVTGA